MFSHLGASRISLWLLEKPKQAEEQAAQQRHGNTSLAQDASPSVSTLVFEDLGSVLSSVAPRQIKCREAGAFWRYFAGKGVGVT